VPADNSISSGGECGLAYKLLPSGAASPAAPYYSYAAGLMTVLSVSSELDMAPGAPQGLFLRAALAAIDRSVTPFVMIYMHRSPYVKPTSKAGTWPNYDTRFAGDYSAMLYFQRMLEPLLLQYRVDLIYSGHTHVTQRNCATANFTCALRATLASDGFFEYVQPPAPVSYVVGNLGANTDGVNTNAPPPWLDFESAAFAYARIVVRSATVLEVTLVDTLSGSVIDRSRIVKAPQPAPIAPTTAPEVNSGVVGGAVAVVLAVLAVAVWVFGSIKVRALLASLLLPRSYSPFSGDGAVTTANPRGGAAALAGVVVESPNLAAEAPAAAAPATMAAEARRARVEIAARSGAA
jgi:hypothetical protein